MRSEKPDIKALATGAAPTSNYCYWCGKPATSREHVPPKCIFPENKDSIKAEDFRQNLITVPSCELHNLAKSTDDAYLFGILSLNCDSNETGQRQATTKFVRALRRSKGLGRAVIRQPRKSFILDRSKGLILNTAKITVDRNRLECILEHIGRGLHYHHFGRSFAGQLKICIEFMIDHGSVLLGEASHPQRRLRSATTQMFASLQKHGSNPDSFFYQVALDSSTTDPVMRLTFYGGSCVTLIFISHGQEPVNRL
jgi:hypothetical protein